MPINSPTMAQQKLLFWAALILLLAVSAVSFVATNRLIDLSSQTARTQRTITELTSLLSHLKDVETGTRGYVITGDPRYLDPLRYGRANLTRSLSRLQVYASGDARLSRSVDRLGRLATERVAVAARTVSRRTDGGSRESILGSIANGKAVMVRLRAEVESLTAQQRAEREQRRRDAERLAFITNAAMATGVAITLFIFAWLFILRNREAARRQQVEAELRDLNADLELAVAQRTSELAQTKKLLDAVIENLPDTVFLKDVGDEFRYVLLNEAAERLIGRPREEMLGHVDHELFPRAEATLCLKEDREIAQTGQPRLGVERPLTTSQGSRLIESRKVPLALDGGQRKYVLGIVRDVTDQKSLEKQVREMQRMEAVGRLTGGIAHDFNNLLAIIMGSLELVREQLAVGSETAVIADEALDATERGAELVRRLLAFARKQHLEPTSVGLNERLPGVVPLLQRTLGESIRVEVRMADGLWPAMIDATQVDDALVNLAINARDAMPDGGSLTIETANATLDEDYAAHHLEVTPGDYVMLAVSDTGTGMSPETMARAFEPFFTTKGEGRGSGLGLSQVYGWVKQSAGHIKIYSELGSGTTIKLYLPRAGADGERTDELADDTNPVGGGETVLVVEDNPSVRRTVARQLTELGYSVLEAEDGASALRLIEGGVAFDLLLTDVVMPGGISGYDLAEQAEKLRPGVKLLFTSGYTELAEQRRDRTLRGPLISKPYRKKELGRAIRAVLDNGGSDPAN